MLSAALIWGAVLVGGPALAQGDAAPGPGAAPTPGAIGTTATGDTPQRTGAITGVGQTKPPGAAIGDELGTRPDLQERSRQLDRRIDTGICSGCR
jgi:hypothetical protein